MTKLLFKPPVEFSWPITIIAFIVSIGIITLSNVVPTRRVNKTILTEGLKERELG